MRRQSGGASLSPGNVLMSRNTRRWNVQMQRLMHLLLTTTVKVRYERRWSSHRLRVLQPGARAFQEMVIVRQRMRVQRMSVNAAGRPLTLGEAIMTFRTLLIIKAVICLAFGVYLLVAPASLLGLLGGSLSGAGLFTAREYGAAMIGTLLLSWFAKDVQAREARGAILLDLLVYDGIGVIITLGVVVTGILNALGWGLVLVYAFFTVGSGYILLTEKPFQASPGQRVA